MASEEYVQVEGSQREQLPGTRRMGRADPDEHIDVTLVVPAPQELDPAELARGKRLSREEFANVRGARQEDFDLVQQFARDHGLQTLRVNPTRRTVVLSGPVSAMEEAFRVRLSMYEAPDGTTYRSRSGPLNVPGSLAGHVLAGLGFDNLPRAKRHSRMLDWIDDNTQEAYSGRAAVGTFTPPEVAKLYDFPTGDGSGQCIGIIELGGGLRSHDITAYFEQLKLPPPTVRIVSVDNGRNQPSTPSSADGEVMLDIEVAAAVAPGAQLVVYFTQNTSRGFLDAVAAAINDTTNQPSVISISWGGPEKTWTQQLMNSMDQVFADAAALGITVYCAAGDSGSTDGLHDGNAHVDFPASSPHVVACGGTHLVGSDGRIEDEVVWEKNGATGGGISDVFPVPSWQQNADVGQSVNPPGNHQGRGVPDVAGDADPATGYQIRVDGRQMVVGGTSAVAPLWAGLTALINQQLGSPVGFINPALYEIGESGAFNDITSGQNPAYKAKPGWDACTGWGSPSGKALLDALRGQSGESAASSSAQSAS